MCRDADRHAIVVFELDSKGAATNHAISSPKIPGVPAGLRLDAAGRLFVSAQGLAIYTADGKLLRTLLESERVINCTFGGVELECALRRPLRQRCLPRSGSASRAHCSIDVADQIETVDSRPSGSWRRCAHYR